MAISSAWQPFAIALECFHKAWSGQSKAVSDTLRKNKVSLGAATVWPYVSNSATKHSFYVGFDVPRGALIFQKQGILSNPVADLSGTQNALG